MQDFYWVFLYHTNSLKPSRPAGSHSKLFLPHGVAKETLDKGLG